MVDSKKIHCDTCKKERVVNLCEIHPDTHIEEYCYYCHLRDKHFGDEVYKSKHSIDAPRPPSDAPIETLNNNTVEPVTVP